MTLTLNARTASHQQRHHEPGPSTLRLLGGFELRIGSEAVSLNANCERVLARLAIGAPALRRETLAGRVWEWSSQARAQANLRNALWRIRQVDPRLVIADHQAIRIGNDLVVDFHLSAAHARQLVDHSALCDDDVLAIPADLLETDLLPDWDEDWVLLERERHRQLRIHALEALSGLLVDLGHFARAIDVAYAAIVAEPLRESARAALIRAHVAEGNLVEATREFAAYKRLLHAELGMPPSSRLAALVTNGTGTDAS